MTKSTFDMEAALQALRDGKDLTGKDGILTPLIKQLTEAAMQAELGPVNTNFGRICGYGNYKITVQNY